MKKLYQYFFRGLITALPLGLTIYFFYIFLVWAEQFSMWLIRPFIQEFYLPGMGIGLGLFGIVLLGYLVSHRHIYKLLSFIEVPFTNIPVVKSIYSSLKSFADYFAPHKENTTQQAVILTMPGHGLEIVGLITRKDTKGLPDGFMEGDRVAVYLPMGYNIGGYTVFVPREWLKPIDMSIEDVMRASLFAWMTHDKPK
ncbi:MAG: DUF502 domain-containing protein [Methylophilus sp.]|nr:DUF502 domain-containing protein [Methylophilus sp.]MDP3608407.1 DUF502 domain-containing protein [Methylophilus sp.]